MGVHSIQGYLSYPKYMVLVTEGTQLCKWLTGQGTSWTDNNVLADLLIVINITTSNSKMSSTECSLHFTINGHHHHLCIMMSVWKCINPHTLVMPMYWMTKGLHSFKLPGKLQQDDSKNRQHRTMPSMNEISNSSGVSVYDCVCVFVCLCVPISTAPWVMGPSGPYPPTQTQTHTVV